MKFTKSATLAALAAAMMFGAANLSMAEEGKAKGAEKANAKAKENASDKSAVKGGEGKEGKEEKKDKLRETLDTLGLSADQNAKVDQAYKDNKKAQSDWETANAAQNKELKEKIDAAKTAKDEAALKDLEGKKKALNATRPGQKQLIDSIKTILTPEQNAKFDAAMAPPKKEKDDKGGAKAEGDKHDHKKGDKH